MNNVKKYTQVKVSVESAVATAFKNACTFSNISMASLLSQFMADYASTTLSKRKTLPDYSTRRKRRSAISRVKGELGQIRDCETDYRNRIPENLQSSSVYDRAEEFISYLDDAIEALDSIESV
jgi:hypothetical protein